MLDTLFVRAPSRCRILEKGILKMTYEYLWNLQDFRSAFSLGDASGIRLMLQLVIARAVEPSAANGGGSTDISQISHEVTSY